MNSCNQIDSGSSFFILVYKEKTMLITDNYVIYTKKGAISFAISMSRFAHPVTPPWRSETVVNGL